MNLTDLRLFVLIVEAGSITRGAARAHLALASASARIRELEASLGTSILERGRRGVQPTAAGRALLHHARVVLLQLERLRGELGDYARGLKGQVRLLANTAALAEFLPETLGGFLADHPEVDIDLEERLSTEIVQAVAEGRAELGIVADSVDLGALETFPLGSDRLVLVAHRRHPFAARRRISFAELLDEPFIGLSVGSALQDHLAGHAARLGRRPEYRVRLRSFDAVCRMVARGIGIAVMPEAAARRCQESMAIRRAPLSDPWARRRLMLCARSLEALPPQARLLADHIRARSAKLK